MQCSWPATLSDWVCLLLFNVPAAVAMNTYAGNGNTLNNGNTNRLPVSEPVGSWLLDLDGVIAYCACVL
jgi:hypothetical protein